MSTFMSQSPENHTNEDSSSLADPADFNRDSSNFPVGIKKRCFPEVYPEYATPRKQARSDNEDVYHFSSSPQQGKRECELFFA